MLESHAPSVRHVLRFYLSHIRTFLLFVVNCPQHFFHCTSIIRRKRPSLLAFIEFPPTTCKMRPLLFATPTEEVFELTQEELGSRRVESATAMSMHDEICCKTPITDQELLALPSHSVPNTLYDSAEPATTPPAQTLSTQSLYRMSCGSASPLIEILTPDELAHRNSPSTPQTPPSPGEAVRSDGNKPRSFIQMAMAYDEYGELVAESKLRQHQTPDELSITQLLRLVRKKFHHEVSTRPRIHSGWASSLH